MIEIRQTETFSAWLQALRDSTAKAKIAARVQRLAFGNPGDVRPVGGGVSELRIHHGPGYRVYYVQRGTCCSVVATRRLRTKTLKLPRDWRRMRNEHFEDEAV